MLTKAELLELFRMLNGELATIDVRGEIYLVGGAVMCLVFDARPSTKDVDAEVVPKRILRELSGRIGRSRGLDERWLNDAVKGFFSESPGFSPFLDLSHLKIFAAVPEYLLAMKCYAMRLGPEFHDESDVRFLLRYLNIDCYEDAIRVITHYYPLDRFPQKTLNALEEFLADERGG